VVGWVGGCVRLGGMRLVCLVSERNAPANPYRKPKVVSRVEVECGVGEQLVRWLGIVATQRAMPMIECHPGAFLPQCVRAKDGSVLDADVVVNRVFEDGSECVVEYGKGPKMFTVDWAGRPPTPDPEAIPVVTEPDEWLKNLDMSQTGLLRVVAGEKNPEEVLEGIKDAMIEYAGPIFTSFCAFDMTGDVETFLPGVISMDNFRVFAKNCDVVSPTFTQGHVDDAFRQCHMKDDSDVEVEAGKSAVFMTLEQFFICLVHLSHKKLDQEMDGRAGGYGTQADQFVKFLDLFILPWLERTVAPTLRDMQSHEANPAVQAVLDKWSKQIMQTQEACMLKRVRTGEMLTTIQDVVTSMRKWGYLPSQIDIDTVCSMATFAIQTAQFPTPDDLMLLKLSRVPMELGSPEFRKLIFALAYFIWKKEGLGGHFEDWLDVFLPKEVFPNARVQVDQ